MVGPLDLAEMHDDFLYLAINVMLCSRSHFVQTVA